MKPLAPRNVALFCSVAILGRPFATAAPALTQQSLRIDDGFLTKNKTSVDAQKFNPLDDGFSVGNLKCGVTVQVHSDTNKYEQCPEECPYYAQDIHDGLHCSFICVRENQCRDMNPNRPIADTIKGHKLCRGPIVPDCSEMSLDGTDTCLKCQMFYKVGVEGNCIFQWWKTIGSIVLLCVLGGFFVVYWIYDLWARPNKNPEGLAQGRIFRSDQKMHMEVNGKRELCEIDTNLLREGSAEVGGPGMILHFNFQFVCIIWAGIVALTWLTFCVCVDNALFLLGTRKFGTPRENCILVAWGFETQQRLMWTKVTFLVITYIVTFVGSLIHSWRQMRIFDKMDAETKSMKDYCATLTGLNVDGKGKVELDIQKTIEEELKKKADNKIKVIGVSICWNYKDVEEEVNYALEQDLQQRTDHLKTGIQALTTFEENFNKLKEYKDDPEMQDAVGGKLRPHLYYYEIWALGGPMPPEAFTKEEDKLELTPLKMKPWLEELASSEDAFVVFDSEDERDRAVEVLQGGFDFERGDEKMRLTLEVTESEPDTINWVAFGHSSLVQKLCRFFQGCLLILAALACWTIFFYTPYAYQVFTFNYDNGAEPPFTLAMTFCMVVVLGNAIMYEVCGRVSDYIGFKTRDTREGCYLILYVVACCFNVALDAATTYFMAREILQGLNFRTYYGVKIKDIPTFTQQFETYAMQRILAENTKCYCFPATFLLPFLIEPFITVFCPLWVGTWMVRSHKEWVGRDAEMWMVAFPFDMGRYGDLLLNMLLGILIFYFPGGYTLLLFFGMFFSHIWIYFFDHCRVLQTIPACVYATMEVDWYAQWMLAPITATIASCLCFKANCQSYGYCLSGVPLLEACTGCWFAHFFLHWGLLQFVVPIFRKQHPGEEGKNWKYVAEKIPCSWFNSNPVHCLRTKYVYADKKGGCDFYTLGKERYLRKNEPFGCHFERDEPPEPQDYDNNHLGASKMMSSTMAYFSGK